MAMLQGHMDQEWQNTHTTKPKHTTANNNKQCSNEDTFPDAPSDGAQIHYCYTAMFKPTSQIYMDQTGKFVAPSSTGNNYILILYDYDSNAILAIPFKNHQADCILQAYKNWDMQDFALQGYGQNSSILTTKPCMPSKNT